MRTFFVTMPISITAMPENGWLSRVTLGVNWLVLSPDQPYQPPVNNAGSAGQDEQPFFRSISHALADQIIKKRMALILWRSVRV
jgi:hypothetical protein